MFDSGISSKVLIDGIKSEADIAPDIDDGYYIGWLSSLEQLLYSEVICEQKEGIIEVDDSVLIDGTVSLEGFNADAEADVRFEDIIAVFLGDKQLKKTTLTSGILFDDCYYKDKNGLHIKSTSLSGNVRVIYRVRPAIKSSISDGNVMLPFEFLDLARSYIRSEAYKIANEDELCGKWTAEYNVLLETFRAWIVAKSPQFGI